MAMRTHVLLLRGIGPATHKVMTMRALEAACRAGGLPDTRSLLATGNLVIRADLAGAEVAQLVRKAMAGGGLDVPVLHRSGDAVAALQGANPLAQAARDRPSQVQVVFLPRSLPEGAVAALSARAPEARIAPIGDEIIIDYGGPISDSALTTGFVDRVLGGPATARNWNTVLRLAMGQRPRV